MSAKTCNLHLNPKLSSLLSHLTSNTSVQNVGPSRKVGADTLSRYISYSSYAGSVTQTLAPHHLPNSSRLPYLLERVHALASINPQFHSSNLNGTNSIITELDVRKKDTHNNQRQRCSDTGQKSQPTSFLTSPPSTRLCTLGGGLPALWLKRAEKRLCKYLVPSVRKIFFPLHRRHATGHHARATNNLSGTAIELT